MKKKAQRTRNKNPCAGCQWGYVLNEEQVYCLCRGASKMKEKNRRIIEVDPNVMELFVRVLLKLKPPPKLTISEWADQFRRMSPEASARPGRWRTDNAPYLREIMDAISDPHVHEVVLKSSSQVGKTGSDSERAGLQHRL